MSAWTEDDRSYDAAANQPPAAWPPVSVQGRPGDGNPHAEAPPSRRASSATVVGVWGIIAAFGAAAGAGYVAANVMGDRVRLATYEQDKRERNAHEAAVQETLTTIRVDIAKIKQALRIIDEPQPITPEKKPK